MRQDGDPRNILDDLEGPNEVCVCYPDAIIPAGITFADLLPAERIIFDWDEGSDSRAIVAAFKVYEAVAAALRAKKI